ncbi:homeobox leucine zipper protein [Actinidia rufa]|uniref:Homeobox leucine zipper protein n=1 Tax=Actinidia rufa TaxID=165716 RepID=A0A7J0F0D1_9ERIC|nr:homeobox leucine zipper protein [Actinidia rufa]
MELGLSLGDPSRPFGFLPKNREVNNNNSQGLGFCMSLGINGSGTGRQQLEREKSTTDESQQGSRNRDDPAAYIGSTLQLDLLPLSPLPRHTSSHGSSEVRGFDVNRLPPPPPPPPPAAEDGAAAASSPNSGASSFQMDLWSVGGSKRGSPEAGGGGNDGGVEAERESSRASDDDDNGIARKKLRLSKEQSAYLEESFKEHNTLNPKQKLALAKQLNLRPRQVEVWFQNRRARTKLKQTEVDCEYLKRCCETLTEENRRLHKELQELRALKNTSNPFYMQLPATTLTMCPSCERVAATATTTTASSSMVTPNSTNPPSKATPASPFPLARPRLYPFSHTQSQPHPSAAS